MNELMGADLDAAVAVALGLKHVVESRGSGGKPIAVWLLAASGSPDYAAGPFRPANDPKWMNSLMCCQDITVIRNPGAKADGDDKWIAGFEFMSVVEGYSAIDQVEHAATGPSPMTAVCRAVVRRHHDRRTAQQAYDERVAQEQPSLRDAMDAEQQDKGSRLAAQLRWQTEMLDRGYRPTAEGWVKDEATQTSVVRSRPAGTDNCLTQSGESLVDAMDKALIEGIGRPGEDGAKAVVDPHQQIVRPDAPRVFPAKPTGGR